MNNFQILLFSIVLAACASTDQGLIWIKDGVSAAQIDKDLEHCAEIASSVMRESSKGLHKGGISTARSSTTQIDAQNGAFEDNPTNRKIVREHCMKKKNYVKARKQNDS